MKNNITLPRLKNLDSGLSTNGKGVWRVEYRRGGKRRYKTLMAAPGDRPAARLEKARFYEALIRDEGATQIGQKPVDPTSLAGIYEAGFIVKIRGVHVGSYKSLEEARAAKREYLKNPTPSIEP